jgi:hypothetical protein
VSIGSASLDWQTYSSARGTVLEFIDTSIPIDDNPDDNPGFGVLL